MPVLVVGDQTYRRGIQAVVGRLEHGDLVGEPGVQKLAVRLGVVIVGVDAPVDVVVVDELAGTAVDVGLRFVQPHRPEVGPLRGHVGGGADAVFVAQEVVALPIHRFAPGGPGIEDGVALRRVGLGGFGPRGGGGRLLPERTDSVVEIGGAPGGEKVFDVGGVGELRQRRGLFDGQLGAVERGQGLR